MSTKQTLPDRAQRLIEELRTLCEDRGVRADLRRGFSRTTEYRAWPWVARWCDLANPRQRVIHVTVAAAYAAHPELADGGNLGTTMRQIAQRDEKGDKGLESFEARFRRLIVCQTAKEVCLRLPPVIHAAAQRGVAINYQQLFMDLCRWDRSGEDVKVRWAAEYWRASEQGASE